LYGSPGMPISALRRLARNPERFYVQAASVSERFVMILQGQAYEVALSTTLEEVAAQCWSDEA